MSELYEPIPPVETHEQSHIDDSLSATIGEVAIQPDIVASVTQRWGVDWKTLKDELRS